MYSIMKVSYVRQFHRWGNDNAHYNADIKSLHWNAYMHVQQIYNMYFISPGEFSENLKIHVLISLFIEP